jgi:hypothetical protein
VFSEPMPRNGSGIFAYLATIYILLLLYVVVPFLFRVARCLGGVRHCAFLFSVGFFL